MPAKGKHRCERPHSLRPASLIDSLYAMHAKTCVGSLPVGLDHACNLGGPEGIVRSQGKQIRSPVLAAKAALKTGSLASILLRDEEKCAARAGNRMR